MADTTRHTLFVLARPSRAPELACEVRFARDRRSRELAWAAEHGVDFVELIDNTMTDEFCDFVTETQSWTGTPYEEGVKQDETTDRSTSQIKDGLKNDDY